jgi:regulatory protein
MASDGERLAPVTWLFGSPEPPAEEVAGPDVSPSAPPAPVPAPVRASAPAPAMAPATQAAVREILARAAAGIKAREAPAPRRENAGKFDRISNVSMHALGRRGMSVLEMRDYLLGRDFESDEVEEEVERLVRVGLLDDFELAETLIRTLRDRKGLGRSALVAELRRRKLDGEAIDAALEDLDDDELERAFVIAEKRAGQLRSLDHETAKRRLSAFLMRKGYSGGIVQAVVARALSGTADRASTGPVFR